MWRASEVVIDYTSPSQVIGIRQMQQLKLSRMLGTFNLGEITTVETGYNGAFCHDEAGVTIVLEAQSLVRV